ncbi:MULTISPECIES: GMP/IMP nucleotidase [Marinobacter]|uniref:GMP/IMP nucleotidase n=1 Tax=Marinobacter suaedae TaxID=3057675 RepID=A0ABT8VZ16_9GAMM|nr:MULTISPECIES: GMP/IMP nucleotidase [unclassified Marinobacter]MBZ2169374.1 GMP/IMP nucleotidase [Marinobacter sp. F4216]MDO3721239.1 GMP/IMP nucleotidase [Marinobacter sp. chi1]
MVNWSSLNTVFLDMDGTLLDLHFDNHFWLEHLPLRYAEQHNLAPQEAKDRLIPMIMAERGSLNWYCTDYWSERLNLDITALKAEVGERIGYRPHVVEFLQTLKAGRLHSVIVTNCHPDPLALKLERTGLADHVEGIVSSHQFGKAKEDPEFWQDLQNAVPYNPASTLMVDDSLPVLESARRAGIGQCLAILAPDSQQAPRPAHSEIPGIRHFDEILPGLRRQQSLQSAR